MPRSATFIARTANINEARRLLDIDVEIIPNRLGIGRVQVQLERHDEVVPVKLIIVEATSFKALLRPGETVQALCDQYNLAMHSIRSLRDQVEHCFGFGNLPTEANAALPTFTQLDSIIHDREQARVIGKLVLIKTLKGEIRFWEQLRTALASTLARALGQASDRDRLMTMLDGLAVQRRRSPNGRELSAGAEARGGRPPPRLKLPRRSRPPRKAKLPR